MTKQEFERWQAVTQNSQFRWTEDEIYRLNGRGAFYYHGGEDGIHIKIQKDGMLEAGNYEGAIPHIGEAFFEPVVQRQCKDFNEAYKIAMEAGGKQFLTDMLTQPEIITPPEAADKVRVNFYCPLTVYDGHPYDDESNTLGTDFLVYHEDAIRDSLIVETHRGACKDMAEFFSGSPSLQNKLLSVQWDVECICSEIHGCMVDEIVAYRDQQEEKLPGPSPLPFSQDRMEQILDKALDWIGNQESGGELYNTLVEQLHMSDDEIAAAGFYSLSEYFYDPAEKADMKLE